MFKIFIAFPMNVDVQEMKKPEMFVKSKMPKAN